MIYGDDQCANCGWIRVARSTLCADCLLRLYNRALRRGLAMAREKKGLEEKVEKLTKLVEMLLDYIISETTYNGGMRLRLEDLQRKVQGGDLDEKDRESENTEK